MKTKLEEYKADANEALCFKLGMYIIDAHYSLRKIFGVVAGQLSDSQNIFFGQNRKIIGFCFIQIHVLVFSNSVNTANLTKKSQNTQEIGAFFIHWRPSHPKYYLGVFLDYNFSSDILSGKVTKVIGYFRNLACFFRQTGFFCKTAITWTRLCYIQFYRCNFYSCENDNFQSFRWKCSVISMQTSQKLGSQSLNRHTCPLEIGKLRTTVDLSIQKLCTELHLNLIITSHPSL